MNSKIAHTLAKLKPFVIYNDTQAKLIMKDVFVNDRTLNLTKLRRKIR